MPAVIPPSMLFRARAGLRRALAIPKSRGRLVNLPAEYELRDLSLLENPNLNCELRAAWNDDGLGFTAIVKGLDRPPQYRNIDQRFAEGLHLWIDTRDTQSIHRAGRFCQQFAVLPIGGGPDHAEPFAKALPIARAREEPPEFNPAILRVQSGIETTTYWLDVWLPAEALHGFNPAETPRLGFTYHIRTPKGDRLAAMGLEFPVASDPSLWMTLELER